MARPRVFISSTYYDLKHIRASLDVFVSSLGFDSILSEKGDIAYSPDIPLDQSCYKEVTTADIFVIVIGGRYGSAASGQNVSSRKTFFQRYDSITKLELQEAIRKDIPVYILIESAVYAEYQTYLVNKDNEKTKYAHVDSVNVFTLIEDILIRPKNNPIKTFEKFAEAETWLREQWSGLFRELLARMSQDKQLADLHRQIEELREVNDTLKSYLESLLQKVAPEQSDKIIEVEDTRRESAKLDRAVRSNELVQFLLTQDLPYEKITDTIKKATTVQQFKDEIKLVALDVVGSVAADRIEAVLKDNPGVPEDLDAVRLLLGLAAIDETKSG